LIRLAGVEDAEAASAYAGATLLAPRDSIELQPGEFLDADLAGCDVCGIDGTAYGSVERVEHYPASDMLVVNGHLVPMVAAIVRSIDIERRRIIIDPPEGLL
jgi:16S rRNA processing protein RimM